MGINPDRPPSSDAIQGIQRVTYGDLPDPDGTPAFTVALVEQTVGPNAAGLYMVQITGEPVGHAWIFIGPSAGGGGSTLPTLRFVVARSNYGGGTIGDAVPNTTYTNPDPAVALNAALAAAATYRATLQALPTFAGLAAKCTVLLHPDRYAANFVIPDGVTVQGLGAEPSDVLIDSVVMAPTAYGNALRNVRVIGAGGISVPPASTQSVDLSEVEAPASGVPTNIAASQGIVTIAGCSLGECFISNTSSVSSGTSSYQRVVVSGSATLKSRFDVFAGDPASTLPLTVSGTSSVRVADGVLRSSGPQGFSAARIADQGRLSLLRVSVLGTTNPSLPLVDLSAAVLGASLTFRDIENEDLSSALVSMNANVSVSALANEESAFVTSTSVNANTVGFTSSSMPADGRDVDEVLAAYPALTPATSAGPFVMRVLPNAMLFPPGRKIVFRNTGSASNVNDGPVALATATPGQTIAGLPSVDPPIAVSSQDYIILAPGSFVELYVRRDRAGYELR